MMNVMLRIYLACIKYVIVEFMLNDLRICTGISYYLVSYNVEYILLPINCRYLEIYY